MMYNAWPFFKVVNMKCFCYTDVNVLINLTKQKYKVPNNFYFMALFPLNKKDRMYNA